MEFHKYQHVERFGHSEVACIEDGKCYIFPKLDGTNASVWMDGDQIKAGSRNRELSLEQDNAGFYKAVLEMDALQDFFCDYPNFRLYGEWLVPHTLKDYRDDAWRKFYVFDVIEGDEESFRHLPYWEYQPLMEKYGIEYVPAMRAVTNGRKDTFIQLAEENDYLMKPGFIGEGVVVKRYDFRNKYGRQTWAKIVRSEFKEKHVKAKVPCVRGPDTVERDIAAKYITKTLVDKERAKITTAIESETPEGKRPKPIQPRLLGVVWHCMITEELANALKKWKNPTIDFKLLSRYVTANIKEHADDLF